MKQQVAQSHTCDRIHEKYFAHADIVGKLGVDDGAFARLVVCRLDENLTNADASTTLPVQGASYTYTLWTIITSTLLPIKYLRPFSIASPLRKTTSD